MKRQLIPLALAIALAGLCVPPAQAESFTYHGSLSTAEGPADGRYDLRLTLYSAESGGSMLAGPVEVYGVDVHEGNFSTRVDFASATAAAGGWLDVAVRSAGGAWETLDGRSMVAPAGSACPGSWTLDGNAGNPPGSYLGTADTGEVQIRQNAEIAIRLRGAFGAVELNPWSGAAAPGLYATSLGLSNGAKGNYSFAGGYNSLANNTASFVWGDRDSSRTYSDSAPDQFIIGAKGGVGINTSTADDGSSPLNKTLTLAPANGSSAVSLSMQLTGNESWNFGNFFSAMTFGYHSASTSDIAMFFGTNNTLGLLNAIGTSSQPFKVGTNATNGNGAYLSPGGTWTNASSRFFKQGFANVDAGEVLARLVALPIQSWTYLDDDIEGRHLGPVAEDFASAFGLGKDSQHISTVDANGVALVAIQGLNSKVDGERSRVDQLEAENAALRARLDQLAAQVEHLTTRAE